MISFSEYLPTARAGDILEFWRREGLAYNAAPVRTRLAVLPYLIFPTHVQVAYMPFGATVDSSNFIRVYRRARP